MTLTIPDARQQILIVAWLIRRGKLPADVAADTLERTVREGLVRRPYVRKAPAKSKPMTAALRAALRADARANPDDTYHEIAERHGVNSGRVSEALAGFRRTTTNMPLLPKPEDEPDEEA